MGDVVSADAEQSEDAEDVLRRPVYTAGGNKAFRDLTVADVEARAGELRTATGWGPTARVASVARAWADLARVMTRAGATTVAELDPKDAAARAGALWVVPPRGSLL
jgi:hypothetical protein